MCAPQFVALFGEGPGAFRRYGHAAGNMSAGSGLWETWIFPVFLCFLFLLKDVISGLLLWLPLLAMPPHHNGLLTLWNCKLNINSSSTSGLGHGVLSQQQKINLYSIFSDFQVGFFFFFLLKKIKWVLTMYQALSFSLVLEKWQEWAFKAFLMYSDSEVC